MASRCPFLKRATLQQIKGSRETVLASIARKCPVASQRVLTTETNEDQAGFMCPNSGTCPFLKGNSRCEKNLKQIAMKCCGPAGATTAVTMATTSVTVATNLQSAKTSFMIDAAAMALDKKRQDNTYRIFGEVERSAQEPGKCHLNGPKCAQSMNPIAKKPAAVYSIFPRPQEQQKINWSSNDYLGLSVHPRVIDATVRVITKNGVGSGGTRNISGTSPYHVALENRLASWHSHAQALLFSSCYVANENVISQLAALGVSNGKRIHLISDEKNHASMIQGIMKAVKNFPGHVRKSVFRHNDMENLESILRGVDDDAVPVILFESVYSMDGDMGNVDAISMLAKEHGALTFCDEVHAVGLYGRGGHGFCQPHHRIDFITGTLGKALGSLGGYVTSSDSRFIEYFRLHCPGLIFTTSLPPAIAAAAEEALKISDSPTGDDLRVTHRHRVGRMKQMLLDFLPDHQTVFDESNHVIPVFVNDAEKVTAVQHAMTKRGHYVQAINFPTVPKGTERLRIVVTPMHSDRQIDQFASDLKACMERADFEFSADAVRCGVTNENEMNVTGRQLREGHVG